jgi:4-aminobutyrate aminotransferase-like enzyme
MHAPQSGLRLRLIQTIVLRALVPLTADDALLDRGLAILGECFDELT